MSARVLNPAMMTEISRNLGSGGGGGGGGRAAPSKAALARVRRDLFGPVDHAAARALAERELRAQSLLDADRWGFNFQLGQPKSGSNSRYEWVPVTEHDVVPEPYALRGMPYLRTHAPGTPRKLRFDDASTSPTTITTTITTTTTTMMTSTSLTAMMSTMAATTTRIVEQMETVVTPTAERTPPQEPRVPEIGEATTTPSQLLDADTKRKRCAIEQTTPVLPPAARKQSTITDFMKSRKRGLNGTKSMLEPPEKITRNAGQIRS
ncbi:uncharacterized protein DDB_G0280205-like [Pogonomyrmex barbatus]|uniref:Uncharacterized protein DDB_G0280205-like n=1 Tax=Pogonomyrmex barbatus TaxID=144034 RepID=A0A6I9W9D0_9HYME|nr:uncharacterized protein DDB_G0280205-like [Pogonomyrmex barbatus]